MESLLQKPQHSDELPDFWNAYYPKIWDKMHKALRSFDLSEQDKDDIVQDAIVKLYARPTQTDHWSDWYCTVAATNLAKTRLEQSKRRRQAIQQANLNRCSDHANTALTDLFSEDLEQAKQKLSIEHRVILDLTQKGYSREEVASCLGLTENQVKRRLQRARYKLKILMNL